MAVADTEVGAGGSGVRPRRVFRNTAIFSFLTGVSRLAGMFRDQVASAVFATDSAISAFTIAFQVPNLLRALFADAALSAAFVPVFTDLMVQGKKREAGRLFSSMLLVMAIALTALTLFFFLVAGLIMPLFIGSKVSADVTVGLARVMCPVVLLLGVNGLIVGVLQAHDHFSIPAFSPVVWNLVIIGAILGLKHEFGAGTDHEIYAYAVGVLIGTVVQLLMAVYALRRIDFSFEWAFEWRDPRVRQVLLLMVPVSAGLGVINLDILINSFFGTLVSSHAPRAINLAFLLYMLPQGVFSVAVTTVLFPTLSDFAARGDLDGLRRAVARGLRTINVLLIPSAAFFLVLSVPVVRIVFQHGKFHSVDTQVTALALFWFAFSLPLNGINSLLTRTFYALQDPWVPTKFSLANLTVDLILSLALYKPFGVAGLVIGTGGGNLIMAYLQASYLSIRLDGDFEGPYTRMITARVVIAAVLLGFASWIVWTILEAGLGDSLPAQIVEMALAGGAGLWIYARAVLRMRVPEALQVSGMIRARLRPS